MRLHPHVPENLCPYALMSFNICGAWLGFDKLLPTPQRLMPSLANISKEYSSPQQTSHLSEHAQIMSFVALMGEKLTLVFTKFLARSHGGDSYWPSGYLTGLLIPQESSSSLRCSLQCYLLLFIWSLSDFKAVVFSAVSNHFLRAPFLEVSSVQPPFSVTALLNLAKHKASTVFLTTGLGTTSFHALHLAANSTVSVRAK